MLFVLMFSLLTILRIEGCLNSTLLQYYWNPLGGGAQETVRDVQPEKPGPAGGASEQVIIIIRMCIFISSSSNSGSSSSSTITITITTNVYVCLSITVFSVPLLFIEQGAPRGLQGDRGSVPRGPGD